MKPCTLMISAKIPLIRLSSLKWNWCRTSVDGLACIGIPDDVWPMGSIIDCHNTDRGAASAAFQFQVACFQSDAQQQVKIFTSDLKRHFITVKHYKLWFQYEGDCPIPVGRNTGKCRSWVAFFKRNSKNIQKHVEPVLVTGQKWTILFMKNPPKRIPWPLSPKGALNRGFGRPRPNRIRYKL